MMERIAERRKAAGEGGFTLIELLVVIIILGILAAVVVFAVGGVGDKGQSAACKIDTRTLRTAGEAYFANDKTAPSDYGNGSNPTNWDGTAPNATTGAGAPVAINQTTWVSAGFLSEVSTYHNVIVYDSNDDSVANGGPGSITPTLAVTILDGRCGTVGVKTGGTNY